MNPSTAVTERAPRRITAGLAVLVLAGLVGLGCGRSGRSGSVPPRGVVLIVIDTLREDRLGCTGYPSASTPHLDRLAARGVRFSRAYTPVPVTLPAVSSLLTGRLPLHHGVRDNEHYVLSPGETTLAERFRDAGWRTAAILGSAILSADRGLDQGFEDYDDRFAPPYPVYDSALAPFAGDFGTTRRRADVVTDLAVRRIRAFAGERFFLMAHYFDVHAYYDPPPAYGALHPGDRYDGEISFVDAEIGRLLDALPDRDDVLVVVVSDHGEALGEHGEPEHGFLLYQSTIRVPILIAGPGVPAGLVRDDPVSLIDLEPTLARRCGLPDAAPPRDGATLRLEAAEERTATLYTETMRPLVSYGWSELRAVVRDDRKLIEGPAPELYDVERDPGEARDLGAGAAANDLRRELREITGGETREDVLAALRGDVDPERDELLRSLGYIGGDEGTSPEDRSYPNPRDELPRWLAWQDLKAVYRRAVTAAADGRSGEAVALFDSVLAGGMVRADVRFNRGLARRGLGDERGFREDLEAALALDPAYAPALVEEARGAEAAGRTEDARKLWRRILTLEPANASALRALAYGYLKEGAPGEALPYLRSLVGAEPENAGDHYNLAVAALQTGRTDEAREHLERFLSLAPGDANAAEARRVLDQLSPR